MGMVLISYPFLIFVGLQHVEPRWLSVLILAVVGARLMLSKALIAKMPWLPVASLLGALTLIFSIVANNQIGVLLYPVAINIALFSVFSFSLFKKPSVIESFARISEPNLDEHGVKYTEKVTFIWCVFFVLNGAISLYTALYASPEVWMIYNGLIAYIAMGTLFILEWLVRQVVKKRSNEQY